MSLLSAIKHEASELLQETIDHRRHLHAHPELSYEEKETATYVQSQLDKSGIEYESGIADNGIVALIKGTNPDSKVIAMLFRFDQANFPAGRRTLPRRRIFDDKRGCARKPKTRWNHRPACSPADGCRQSRI